MTSDTYDPDLNLQSFNDHGIFTLEELNQLSHVVKPQLSALHLNIRSLSKHFDELCHLSDHISSKISKSVNIIAKLKRHVATQSLISIYYALVYAYLNYGCILWGQ